MYIIIADKEACLCTGYAPIPVNTHKEAEAQLQKIRKIDPESYIAEVICIEKPS